MGPTFTSFQSLRILPARSGSPVVEVGDAVLTCGARAALSVCARARPVVAPAAADLEGSGMESSTVWADAKVSERKEGRESEDCCDSISVQSMGPRALKGS